MSQLPIFLSPDRWMRQIFASQAACDGGVVRRKVRDVERMVGKQAFEDEIRRRGFTAIENGTQYVIFCNQQPLRRIG